jgi:hypothetical protein
MIQQQINKKIINTLIKIILKIVLDENTRNQCMSFLKDCLDNGMYYLTPILEKLEKILGEFTTEFLIDLIGDITINSHQYSKIKEKEIEFSKLERCQTETISFIQNRPNLKCALIKKGALKINMTKKINMTSNLKIQK